ncbi:hypothetical protein [Maritimibacter dapengensis]|uniref:Peptidase propeptide and YPEB domain-containing protein n=1 Tax=Maritimibacter dapengensis TaxID=2836868 RepID=A0ABS6T0R1_9RHOB|nr:hypothetical protein [Maritimibacter dapengensis]MBV7378570.1 hypothetical protein [Maritimibacter dapengensis]
MKRKLLTLSAVALIGASTAFAQDIRPEGLNEPVFNDGVESLRAEGYTVSTVRQSTEGDLTFVAMNDGMYRVLILDGNGVVVSDETGTDLAALGMDMEMESDSEVTADATQGEDILPDGGRVLNGEIGGIDIEIDTGVEAGAGSERLDDEESEDAS